MFDWFRSSPSAPVPEEQRTWIEHRFGWLTRELGIDRLRSAPVILPTPTYFPNEYNGTWEDISDLMHRIATYMNVDPGRLRLDFYEPHVSTAGSIGQYSERDGLFDIRLETSILPDPLAVASTLAHEIGHVVLLGQRRVSVEEEDHELLTDLLTVFLGVGIFTANSVVHENYWSSGGWSGWSIGQQGYMTMEMYGYAFALFALARSEPKPDWMPYLRLDVRSAMKKGMRFIRETDECGYEFLP